MRKFKLDTWVEKYVKDNKISLGKNPEPLKTRLVGKERAKGQQLYKFGKIRRDSIDEWEIIETVGDGTCLIHSFLLLLSPTYHRLSKKNKGIVGRAARLAIANKIKLDEDRKQMMLDINEFIDEFTAEKIADFLGYGLITLRFMTSTKTKYAIPMMIVSEPSNKPYLIVANSGGDVEIGDSGRHFEAVRRRGSMESPAELGTNITRKMMELMNNSGYLVSGKSKTRCDSPRKPWWNQELKGSSITALDARSLATQLDRFQRGDKKNVVCGNLDEAGVVTWYHELKKQNSSPTTTRKRGILETPSPTTRKRGVVVDTNLSSSPAVKRTRKRDALETPSPTATTRSRPVRLGNIFQKEKPQKKVTFQDEEEEMEPDDDVVQDIIEEMRREK